MDHMRGGQEHILHCCNIGLVGIADPLQVWDRMASLDDDELPPAGKPCGGLDRPVDGTVPVQVAGNKVHIYTNYNLAIMHFDGAMREVKLFFYINEVWVRQGFVVGDECIQLNNHFVVVQGLEMVALNDGPWLFGCECKMAKEGLWMVHHVSNWPLLEEA